MTRDPLLCVGCGARPVAPGGKNAWCAECIEGLSIPIEDRFGRCYQCAAYRDCASCIGVPCECPCPGPDERARAAALERAVEKIGPALATLTPEERKAIGL